LGQGERRGGGRAGKRFAPDQQTWTGWDKELVSNFSPAAAVASDQQLLVGFFLKIDIGNTRQPRAA